MFDHYFEQMLKKCYDDLNAHKERLMGELRCESRKATTQARNLLIECREIKKSIEEISAEESEVETLIDKSNIFSENNYTLKEKVQRLIVMAKNNGGNDEPTVIESGLLTIDGYRLTDKNGLRLIPATSA